MTGGRPCGAAAAQTGRHTVGASARPGGRLLLLLVAGLGLLARPAAAQTEVVEYYGHDALGSVRIVFTASGVATARADYEPFGEGVTIAGMPAGPLPAQQFTGQERDALERQDYFGARYYRPRHGRFSQVDPVYAGLFDPQQWNRYAYARNNPLSFVDPDGLCTTTTNIGVTATKSRDGMVFPPTQACGGGAGPSTMPTTGAYFGVPPSLTDSGPGPSPRPRREPGGRDGSERKNLIPLVNETTGETTYVTVEELLTETAKALVLAIGMAVAPTIAEALIVAPVAAMSTSLSPRIMVSQAAMQHVFSRHGSSSLANASRFSPNTDFASLLAAASRVPATPQSYGPNLQRIVDAGRFIGNDINNGGRLTTVYTVITDRGNNLVTMFPGLPRR